MGAGPVPVDGPQDHQGRRPPIPIVPVPAAAPSWVAAVTGSAAPPRVRVVDAAAVEVLGTRLAAFRATAGMSVGEVALAVDTGRDLAAAAAADGVGVLVTTVSGARDDTAAGALAAVLAGLSEPVANGPLGALRRLGDATCAVLAGVALGAGERGLGCVCDGLAALAGAAVAAGIEPDLRARLAVARAPDDPAAAALVERLGLTVVPVRG